MLVASRRLASWLILPLAACGRDGPNVVSVEPPCGAPNADVPVRIRGVGLVPPRVDLGSGSGAGYEASLDGTALLAVAWQTTDALAAVVPAGVPAGLHALSVVDPQGRTLGLAGAYRVDCAGATDGGDAIPDASGDPAPEVASVVVFQDLFDAPATAWTWDMNGAYSTSAGTLRMTPDYVAHDGVDLWIGSRPENDYRVEERLTLTAIGDATVAAAGVLLRVQAVQHEENRYYFCGLAASPPAVIVDFYDNPAMATSVELGRTLTAGSVTGLLVTLEAIASGSTLTCRARSLSPPAEVTVTDASYPTGSWGLRAFEATALVEDVIVYAPP